MSILIIDTSIIGVAMAIIDADATQSVLWSKLHPENMGSVPAIGAMLQEGLRVTNRTLADIRGVCVSHGPGSFTGIKVGLAFAYGLKLALNDQLPMVGVSALEEASAVFASERGVKELRLFLPATKTHGFVATYSPNGLTSALVDASSEAFAGDFGTSSNDSLNLVFRDWPILQGALQAATGKPAEIIDEIRMCNAAICGMAEKARKTWPDGFTLENPSPRYLRLSTAEEKLQAPKGI